MRRARRDSFFLVASDVVNIKASAVQIHSLNTQVASASLAALLPSCSAGCLFACIYCSRDTKYTQNAGEGEESNLLCNPIALVVNKSYFDEAILNVQLINCNSKPCRDTIQIIGHMEMSVECKEI